MKAVPLLALALAMSCAKSKAPGLAAPRARILGIAHMALFVTDLEKSRAFYKDFLGFDEPYSLKRADGHDHSAFIKVNDEQYVELIAAPPKNDGRINHIAFYTDDAEALRRTLAERGAAVPSKTSKGRLGNAQWITTDPDGHHVELVQYQPEGWTMRQRGQFMPETRISRRIAHIGILIGALPAAFQFYRDQLGFQEIWRGGPSTKQLSWINLKVPDGDDYLELMLYDQLPAPVEQVEQREGAVRPVEKVRLLDLDHRQVTAFLTDHVTRLGDLFLFLQQSLAGHQPLFSGDDFRRVHRSSSGSNHPLSS